MTLSVYNNCVDVESSGIFQSYNSSIQTNQSPELVCAYYILYMCAHAFHMCQSQVLSDNEWAGWLQWMKTAFAEGEILDYWKKYVQPEKWFDPAFIAFINKEVIRNN